VLATLPTAGTAPRRDRFELAVRKLRIMMPLGVGYDRGEMIQPQKAKLSAGKMLMPGVVNHATDLVEHPALVADRILGYAAIVGRENVVAGTDCGPRRPGPCRPCVGQAADACRRRALRRRPSGLS
jgi:hypothetical protein